MEAAMASRGLLTEVEVTEILQVPLGTVRWWRQQRRLPYVKLGRHVRIRAEDLERFLRDSEVPTLGGASLPQAVANTNHAGQGGDR